MSVYDATIFQFFAANILQHLLIHNSNYLGPVEFRVLFAESYV